MNEFSGMIYSSLGGGGGGGIIFLTVFGTKFVVTCSQKIENLLTNKNSLCKNIFNRDFFYRKIAWKEGHYFPENVLYSSLNILSKSLEINIKCHERFTRGKNFWIKQISFMVAKHMLTRRHFLC